MWKIDANKDFIFNVRFGYSSIYNYYICTEPRLNSLDKMK